MVDRELIDFYREETKQSERIVTGFLAAGIEPPHRDTMRSVGLTFKQSKILDRTAPTLAPLD